MTEVAPRALFPAHLHESETSDDGAHKDQDHETDHCSIWLTNQLQHSPMPERRMRTYSVLYRLKADYRMKMGMGMGKRLLTASLTCPSQSALSNTG